MDELIEERDHRRFYTEVDHWSRCLLSTDDIKREIKRNLLLEEEDGLSPLTKAAASGDVDVLRWVFTDLRADDEELPKALEAAFWNKRVAAVKYLVKEAKCNVNSNLACGHTPLTFEVQEGARNHELIRWLVEEGKADPNMPDRAGNTPLHWACDLVDSECFDDGDRYNLMLDLDVDAFKYLVETAGADIEARDPHGNTLLAMACERGTGWQREHVIRYLCERKANVNAENSLGSTPFSQAMYSMTCRDEYDPSCPILSILANAKADLNAFDDSGKNLVYSAMMDNNFRAIRFLASRGIDVNAPCSNEPGHDIALWEALLLKREPNTLLECKADINLRPEGEEAMLVHAAKRGDPGGLNYPGDLFFAEMLSRFITDETPFADLVKALGVLDETEYSIYIEERDSRYRAIKNIEKRVYRHVLERDLGNLRMLHGSVVSAAALHPDHLETCEPQRPIRIRTRAEFKK